MTQKDIVIKQWFQIRENVFSLFQETIHDQTDFKRFTAVSSNPNEMAETALVVKQESTKIAHKIRGTEQNIKYAKNIKNLMRKRLKPTMIIFNSLVSLSSIGFWTSNK